MEQLKELKRHLEDLQVYIAELEYEINLKTNGTDNEQNAMGAVRSTGDSGDLCYNGDYKA